MVAEAGGTEVVPTGLQGHTLPQRVEAYLALEILQCGLLSCCVAAGGRAEYRGSGIGRAAQDTQQQRSRPAAPAVKGVAGCCVVHC